MWSDPSKRPLIVLGVVVLLVCSGVGLWWWNSQAPRRHLEDIVEQAYDHAEIDGPDSFGKYINRRSACTPSGEQRTDSEWRANLGGLARLESEDEAGPAAMRFADGLEADGWEVQRYVVPDGDSDVSELRRVHAERERDTLTLFLQGVAVNVSASTGPCNSAETTDLAEPAPQYEPVTEFP